MLESLSTSALSGIATPIFEAIWGTRGGILGKIQAHRKKKEIANRIDGPWITYEKKFRDRHGQVKFVGSHVPIEIDLVYTDMKFMDRGSWFSLDGSVQDLEMKFRHDRSRFKGRKISEKSIFEIANEIQQLMILGGPGAGKSTFLRKVGLEALRPRNISKYTYGQIPVFVELKRLISKENSIEKLIQSEFYVAGIPDFEEFTCEALKQGKLLILLDGLDEIPYSNLHDAIFDIRDFVSKFSDNRYISTCREGANYYTLLNGFTDIEVTDFDKSQVSKFVSTWFSLDRDEDKALNIEKGKRFLEVLNKGKNSSVRELAGNPLLLTLLCLVYQSSNNLPSNRVSLYQNALDLFTSKWLAFKKVQPNPILNEELNPMMERAMLSQVAYEGFLNERFFFHERELAGKIKSYLEENANAPNHLDSEEILSTIKIYQGILMEQIQGYCSFSHITFQEYLAAQYIYDHNKIEDMVLNHISDPRWTEIFSMVSGLIVSGSDSLLYRMEEESRKFIDASNLRNLITWSELSIRQDALLLKNGSYVFKRREDHGRLENVGWCLVIRHAATFQILGSLLHSYTEASGILRNDNRVVISRLLMKYSQLVISNIYEHVKSRKVPPQELRKFDTLTENIRHARNVTSTLIRLEGYEVARAKMSSLKHYFKESGIFPQLNVGPLRDNLELLKSKRASKDSRSLERDRAYLERFWKNWLKALRLTPYESIHLTQKDIQSLERYLHSYLLVINCRLGAVKVSPSSWTDVLLCLVQRTHTI